MLAEHREAELRAARPLAPFEEERLGHDADGEGALFPRDLRDDRRRARPGAAAHAGGDEDHVGAADELLDALHVLERRLAALLGVGAGAEAARDVRADGELGRRRARVERLRVGIDHDELDAFEAEVDHRIDGVAAGATHADDLDPCLVGLGLFRELDRETHRRHPPVGPSISSTWSLRHRAIIDQILFSDS